MNRKSAIVLLTSVGFAQVGYFVLNKPSVNTKKSIEDYKSVIEELSEVVIPRTNTPGAKDAGVYAFVIRVFNACLNEKERKKLLKGLEDLELYCIEKYSSSFAECSKRERHEVVLALEGKTRVHPLLKKIKNKIWGADFFLQIKTLIAIGYCSSQVGATFGLSYDAFPKKYEPCIPYISSQPSWATK